MEALNIIKKSRAKDKLAWTMPRQEECRMKSNNFSRTADREGWNRNTDFCVDVKTLLRSDKCAKIGKSYQGVLRRDMVCEDFHYEDHYTFVETRFSVTSKRNPRVYEGRYVTVTRWDDGSLHPNLRPVRMDSGFSVDAYAIGVCNELRKALSGLVGEE